MNDNAHMFFFTVWINDEQWNCLIYFNTGKPILSSHWGSTSQLLSNDSLGSVCRLSTVIILAEEYLNHLGAVLCLSACTAPLCSPSATSAEAPREMSDRLLFIQLYPYTSIEWTGSTPKSKSNTASAFMLTRVFSDWINLILQQEPMQSSVLARKPKQWAKRLKSSIELRRTAESNDNSLWMCHYKWPIVVWLYFCSFLHSLCYHLLK